MAGDGKANGAGPRPLYCFRRGHGTRIGAVRLRPVQVVATEPAQPDDCTDDCADGDTRVKLTLALSAGDKAKLKTVAARQGKTVARLVHEWIMMLD